MVRKRDYSIAMSIKSEFQLIDWIRQNNPLSHPEVLTNIGDDMAVIRVDREKLLISTDTILEGVHFDLNTATLAQAGYKAMACSLSDCAAMAALPFIAVVAVALPQNLPMSDAQLLHQGMQKAALTYNCPIVGGDTTSWDKPLAVNVTMLARTGPKEPVLRSGSRPGDAIMVTGELGASLQGRHLEFTPRIVEAQLLNKMVQLHALIDISDGLSSDLAHICRQSHTSALIDSSAIPVSPAAQQSPDPLHAALTDGEDFELLFCVDPDEASGLLRDWHLHSDIRLSRIGQITPPQENNLIQLRHPNGTLKPLTVKGWEHFTNLSGA